MKINISCSMWQTFIKQHPIVGDARARSAYDKLMGEAATLKDVKAGAVDKNLHIRCAAASNPRCPVSLLTQLFKDPEPLVREAAVRNPQFPAKLLKAAFDDPAGIVQAAVIEHSEVSDEMLQRAAKDGNVFLAQKAAFILKERAAKEEQKTRVYAPGQRVAVQYDADEWYVGLVKASGKVNVTVEFNSGDTIKIPRTMNILLVQRGTRKGVYTDKEVRELSSAKVKQPAPKVTPVVPHPVVETRTPVTVQDVIQTLLDFETVRRDKLAGSRAAAQYESNVKVLEQIIQSRYADLKKYDKQLWSILLDYYGLDTRKARPWHNLLIN